MNYKTSSLSLAHLTRAGATCPLIDTTREKSSHELPILLHLNKRLFAILYRDGLTRQAQCPVSIVS